MQIDRRKFLGSACKTCLLAGAGFLISDLAACSPATQLYRVPISEDSVRLPVLAFAKEPLQLVRPDGWVYDIAVRKISPDNYEAVFMQCTHQKNQLMLDGSGFICTLHGSRFSKDGYVKKGPAELPLKKFMTRIEQDQLVIQLKS
jgi:Rieske Fe-S protein